MRVSFPSSHYARVVGSGANSRRNISAYSPAAAGYDNAYGPAPQDNVINSPSPVDYSSNSPASAGHYTKSYHRTLMEVAIVAVIFGVVFLIFWQNVAGTRPTVLFTTDYCSAQAGRYVPDSASAAFSTLSDGRLAYCRVDGASIADLGLAWTGSYACSGITVRYLLSSGQDSVALVAETEIPALFYSNDTLVADLGGTQRFSYSAIIYNPFARTGFDALSGRLKAQDCNMTI